MRNLTTSILATLAAVCVCTAALQCAIAESVIPVWATGAALVVVEVVEVNAEDPQPEIKVSYRQIRAQRSWVDGWWRIAVGFDRYGERKAVYDFDSDLGTFPEDGRSAVLVVPRHDPELTQAGDSAEGFVRDCLFFKAGGETVSVYLSAPPAISPTYSPRNFQPQAKAYGMGTKVNQIGSLSMWAEGVRTTGYRVRIIYWPSPE